MLPVEDSVEDMPFVTMRLIAPLSDRVAARALTVDFA